MENNQSSRVITQSKSFYVRTGGEYGTEYALFRKSDNARLATASDEHNNVQALIELLQADQ